MNLEKRMLEGGGLLKHFLSHQDWSLDDESWQAVAERFAADVGASTARHEPAHESLLS